MAEPASFALNLALSPRRYEVGFWKSDTFKSVANVLDLWSLSLTLIANGMFLRWQGRLLDIGALERCGSVICYMILSVAQHAWSKLSPDSYFRARGKLRVCNRLLRLFNFAVMTPEYFRAMIHEQGGDTSAAAAVCQTTTALTLPPAAALLKCLMVASACIFIFVPGINVPLPFVQQLLLQSANFTVLITRQLAPGMHILHHAGHSAVALQLCVGLNSVVQLAEAATVGTTFPAAHHDQQCMDHAGRMLLMFVDMYFGLLLPVYVAIRLERYAKRLYLHEELGHEEPPLPFRLLLEALVAAVLALVTWVLVLCSHQYLATWVHPL